jgi:hypothetical protein
VGILGRNKALKVAIPRTAQAEMLWEVRRGERRQGRLELRRRNVLGVGSPRSSGSFVLATVEGSETPGEALYATSSIARQWLTNSGGFQEFPEGE